MYASYEQAYKQTQPEHGEDKKRKCHAGVL